MDVQEASTCELHLGGADDGLFDHAPDAIANGGIFTR
jgi:hypothetical protein